MSSLCLKFHKTSNKLLQLHEEFERASNVARASGDVALLKKLIETFEKQMKELGKEFPQKDEFILRGITETLAFFPIRNGTRVLPDPAIWKKKPDDLGYEFDYIWENEYYENRSLSDFGMTREYLEEIGITDPLEQQAWMERPPNQEEEGSIGKIFDIVDAIQQKRDRENDQGINALTTKEVFEAIDAAGYRLGTLAELLAYAKYHWKPEKSEDQLTQEERDQRANVPDIHALGSPFLDAASNRYLPYICWSESRRNLDADYFAGNWYFNEFFLVFRK